MGSVYSSLCFSAVPRENSGSFSSPLNPEQGHIPQTLRCWQSRGQVKSQSGWQSLVGGPAPGCHPLGLLTGSSTSPSISDVGLLYNGWAKGAFIALLDFLCYRFCALFLHSKAIPYLSTTPTAYLAVYILPLLLLIYHDKCVPPFRFCPGCFTSQNRNSNLPEMKNVKYVSSLKRGFSNLAFTSTLHKCSWHKKEGSALLEMVLQMAVFQQTTY